MRRSKPVPLLLAQQSRSFAARKTGPRKTIPSTRSADQQQAINSTARKLAKDEKASPSVHKRIAGGDAQKAKAQKVKIRRKKRVNTSTTVVRGSKIGHKEESSTNH